MPIVSSDFNTADFEKRVASLRTPLVIESGSRSNENIVVYGANGFLGLCFKKLGKTRTDILRMLYEAKDYCSYEDIINNCFFTLRGDITEHSRMLVRVHISRINAALNPYRIKVVPVRHRGYILSYDQKEKLFRLATNNLYAALEAIDAASGKKPHRPMRQMDKSTNNYNTDNFRLYHITAATL